MTALKAHATKLLRRAEKIGGDRKIWTRHGSTVSLSSVGAIGRAIAYAVEKQGPAIAVFRADLLDRV